MLLQKRNRCWLHCSLNAGTSQVASLVGVAARRRESNVLSGAVTKTVETETFTTSAPTKCQVCPAKRVILVMTIVKWTITTHPPTPYPTKGSSSNILLGKILKRKHSGRERRFNHEMSLKSGWQRAAQANTCL